MYSVSAEVLFNNTLVGFLSREDDIYSFSYDKDFLNSEAAFPIAWSLPLQKAPFRASKLFPFFEGLVAEGWMLQVQSQIQKIDERDYFSLLLANGKDLIGGVRIIPRANK
jgi:serine/threonine-protein kinase HipA